MLQQLTLLLTPLIYLFKITINKLSTLANDTHNKYGINSQAAVLFFFQKLLIVRNIATHKSTIPISASEGFLSPKKNIDQSEFNAN